MVIIHFLETTLFRLHPIVKTVPGRRLDSHGSVIDRRYISSYNPYGPEYGLNLRARKKSSINKSVI